MQSDLSSFLESEKRQLQSVRECIAQTVEVTRDLEELQRDGAVPAGRPIASAESLERTLRELVRSEIILSAHIEALQALPGKLRGRDPPTTEDDDDDGGRGDEPDAADTFESLIATAKLDSSEDLEKRISRHDRVREFRAKVWSIRHPGEPMPGSEGDEDEISVMPAAGGARSTICPITRTTFVEPVRNKTCGHTYSRVAIVEYLRTRGGRNGTATCAVAGCEAAVSLRSLESDLEMEREIRRLQLRQPVEPAAAAASQSATQDFTAL